MIRKLAKAGLTALLAVSLLLTVWTGIRIARDPSLRPVIDRSREEIVAALDRAMATEATPARISERLTVLLAETPRNWVAIDAVLQVAEERGLPYDTEAITKARNTDFNLTARAVQCASCAWDVRNCRLSAELMCQAPVALTSLGDIAGLTRGALAYATGDDVDALEVGLSAVGLGATVLIVASGGTTLGLKAGASVVKTARGMRLLSPRLTATLTRATREGIDWAALPAVRGTDDLAHVLRPAVLGPVTDTARALGRMEGALPTTQTLHMVRYVDDATDARRLANGAEAMGPRTVGRMEVLGKGRFLRATARLTNAAAGLLAGFAGMILALAGMAAHLGQTIALRLLRRLA